MKQYTWKCNACGETFNTAKLLDLSKPMPHKHRGHPDITCTGQDIQRVWKAPTIIIK